MLHDVPDLLPRTEGRIRCGWAPEQVQRGELGVDEPRDTYRKEIRCGWVLGQSKRLEGRSETPDLR